MASEDEMHRHHRLRAERAYARYLELQGQIDGFEERVSNSFPTNDRLAANYLKNSDEPEVWVYGVLCKHRDIQEQIIATETAMASLYR